MTNEIIQPLSVEDAVKKTLQGMGLSESFQNTAKLDAFYAINEMPDEVNMKQIHRVDFTPKGDRISIVPVHDIHYGSHNANKLKFQAFLDYIEKTEDTYMLGVGDLIENATKGSVGMGVYEEEIHIDRQIDDMQDMLEPLARKGKILGLMPGNHEYRTAVLIKMDPMRLIAKNLSKITGVDVPFLGYQGFHKWVVGNQTYKAHSFHGRSAAGTPGGRINAVRKQRDIMLDADMYFMGHVHSIQDDADQGFRIDDATDTLVPHKRHYVIGGSLLSYFDGYAEMMGLAPAPQGLVKVDLLKDKKKIIIHKP
jgi:hypothetical protein